MNRQPLAYDPSDFFLVRFPLLPIDAFHQLSLEENSESSLFNHRYLQEAISIASYSLSQQLLKKEMGKETLHSLVKYFIRMSTRATPFGLFSSICCGHSATTCEGRIAIDAIRKRARPDMEWIQKVIDIICKDEKHFMELKVQCNPLLREQAERFSISYLIQNEDKKSITIRKSALSAAIFQHARKEILINDLLNILLQTFPKLEQEKLVITIKTLLQQEFLWFSLLPSLISHSPFEEFLNKVPSQYRQRLSEIYKKILRYSSAKLGEGIEMLNEIEINMREIASSRCSLQVDTISPTASISLSKPLLQEVAEGVEVLLHIDANAYSEPPMEYLGKFIDKYGLYRLVPLHELLDEAKGIGMPKISQDDAENSFSIWLQNAFANCLWERTEEVEITDEIIQKWPKGAELTKATLSTEVFFEVLAESQVAINEGQYSIVFTNLGMQGGAVFGRFLDMFDDSIHNKLKEFYENEEKLEPSSNFVEASFLPNYAKAQNVAINPHFRKELIDLSPGGKSTLFLDEIYVGAYPDRLYFTSKDGTKDYTITATNVLNSSLAPKTILFLRSISMGKYQIPRYWNWEGLSEMPYLPRIRYKKLILSPAQWNVSFERIESSQKDPLIIEKFNIWADKYSIPRYVYIKERDNKLLIDRKNNVQIEILVQLLKRNQKLILVEKMMQSKGEWVQSELGKHSTEFVLPLLKNSAYTSQKPIPKKPQYMGIAPKKRMQLPGGDWLYAKCFISKEEENNFLINYLEPFNNLLMENKIIDQMFFVRYVEEKPHLRIRFKGDSEILTHKLIPLMRDWVYSLMEKGIIHDWHLSSYEREIERYGGLELIEEAETVFCQDSAVVLNLLKNETKHLYPLHIVGAISVLQMLSDLGFELSQQIKLFSFVGIDKTHLKGIKEWRKTLLFPPSPPLQEIFRIRSEALATFGRKMDRLSDVDPFSIVASLIHMHCNRLIGTDRQQENKIMASASYAIEKKIGNF